MKKLSIILLIVIAATIYTQASDVRVKGYYRKDGTYVRPHTRRKPKR